MGDHNKVSVNGREVQSSLFKSVGWQQLTVIHLMNNVKKGKMILLYTYI